MSSPKFMVLKLSDLKVPALLLLVVIAAFSFFMLTNSDKEATFAPETGYKDGMYVANLAFADASLDVVVNVAQNQITSITLDGFDENERTLYNDLNDSISFVNDYVTATQSLQLPVDSNITASTSIIMDAISVALSDEQDATLKTTYQVPLLEELTNDSDILPTEDISLEEESTENAEALTDEADEMTEAETDDNAVPTDSKNE